MWTTPLHASFPSLFAVAASKDAWVQDYWNGSTSGGGWNPIFTRPFNDMEVEEAERLLCGLGKYVLDGDAIE